MSEILLWKSFFPPERQAGGNRMIREIVECLGLPLASYAVGNAGATDSLQLLRFLTAGQPGVRRTCLYLLATIRYLRQHYSGYEIVEWIRRIDEETGLSHISKLHDARVTGDYHMIEATLADFVVAAEQLMTEAHSLS